MEQKETSNSSWKRTGNSFTLSMEGNSFTGPVEQDLDLSKPHSAHLAKVHQLPAEEAAFHSVCVSKLLPWMGWTELGSLGSKFCLVLLHLQDFFSLYFENEKLLICPCVGQTPSAKQQFGFQRDWLEKVCPEIQAWISRMTFFSHPPGTSQVAVACELLCWLFWETRRENCK